MPHMWQENIIQMQQVFKNSRDSIDQPKSGQKAQELLLHGKPARTLITRPITMADVILWLPNLLKFSAIFRENGDTPGAGL